MNLCIYIHVYKTVGGGARKTLGAGMGALELGHWLPLLFMNFLSNRGALSRFSFSSMITKKCRFVPVVAPSSVHLKEGEKRDPRLTTSRIVRCQRLRAEAWYALADRLLMLTISTASVRVFNKEPLESSFTMMQHLFPP